MSEKTYLSGERLSLYDEKLKAKMATDDSVTLGSAKTYTDEELAAFGTEVDEALGALASAVNSKAPATHNHKISDVTNLQSELDGKSDAGHTHTIDSALSTTSTNPVQNKIVNAAIQDAKSAGTTAQNQVSDHTSNKSNPHGVTKSQVGLGNVDNTSDANKPVSTAQATAIADAKKAGTDAQSAIDAHEALTNNPHGVTAAQVGLGNVPNVTTNNQKPTFTAASSLSTLTSGNTLSVQFGKIAKAITDLIAHLANKSNPHGVTAAQVGADPVGSAAAVQTNLNTLNDEFDDHTENADIHFTAAERTKLSGIATGANKYTHPNSGVTAGTYKSVTVNAAGHVTGGSNPTTLAGYGITDAEAKGTATSTVGTHNTSNSAHNDIRLLISDLTTKVNNFLDVDDTTTDQLSELIALIQANASDIESITSGKVNVADIVNNLTTNSSSKVLSAAQGVALKALIDALDSDKVDKVSGKGLSTNDYTTTEKNKLSGIASGAEVNQNAFSNIKVGTTTVAADAKTDTVEFVGSNVTITPDATNDKITFAVASGTTSAAGIVKLSNSTSSTSTSLAATPSAVKSAYDLANTAKTNAATAQTTADSASDAAAAAQSTADTATTNLSSHIGNTSNPHSVTKAQVGLGNVPNVTTNNQTPTYTVATSNAELTSGETMTTAFGKIAKAVSSLIAHLSNISNPHSVTKAQVGLGNVDNTADADKTVKAAGTATTATTLSGLTATVAELNILDGVTATTAELNYVDGVTSNIQTQLNDLKNSVSDGKTSVAAAITAKGVTTASNAEFATMATNINNITTLSEGTSDATIEAADVLEGEIGYGKNGVKVTGSIPNLTTNTTIDFSSSNTTPVIEGDTAFYQTNSDGVARCLIRYPGPNGYVQGNTLFGIPQSTMASAVGLTGDKIKKGTSILGVAGTVTAGSIECSQVDRWTVTNRTTLNAGTSTSGSKKGIIGQINIGTKPRCIISKTINKSYVNNSSYWPFTINYTVNGRAKTGYIYCQNTYANPNYMIFPGLNKYVYDDTLGDITSSYFQSVSQGAGSYISLPLSTSSSSLSASFGRLCMYFSSDFTILYLYAEVMNSSAYEFTNCKITPPSTLYLPMLI